MGMMSKSRGAAKSRRRPITALAAMAAAGLMLQACGTVDSHARYARQPRPPVTHTAHSYAAVGTASRASRYDVVGMASWYGRPYHGRRTASGQIYNMYRMTAAHPTLPFGTRVAVTNLENGRTVIVTINDRGPFKGGRVIDLSRKAASKLGFLHQGLTRVGMHIIHPGRG